MHKRTPLRGAMALALTLTLTLGCGLPAWAQADKPPMKILVGFPPGGSVDVVARLMAEKMRDALGGQTVVVDNKPGAGARVAIEALKNSPPDGNTLILMPSGPMVLFPLVFKKLNYDPVKDFTPISQVVSFQFSVVSGPKSNVRNVAQMLAQIRENKNDPAAATYGSSGNGSVPHMLGLLLSEAAGVPLTHVPFQGGTPSLNALMGGHIAYNIDVMLESLEAHRGGKVRVIAVSGSKRSPQLPDVPTLREQGVNVDASAWFALYGPAGMAPALQNRLSQIAASVIKDASLQGKLNELGLEPIGSTAAQLAASQAADLQKWTGPVKTSGFQAD